MHLGRREKGTGIIEKNKMELYCKKCNQELTKGPLSQAKVSSINHGDEKDLVPLHQYVFLAEAEYNFEIPIDFLVNNKSLNLDNHTESIRLQGCCGPSEFGQLNQICPNCKSEIGLLIDDCWTPRFIAIDSNKISKKPLW